MRREFDTFSGRLDLMCVLLVDHEHEVSSVRAGLETACKRDFLPLPGLQH